MLEIVAATGNNDAKVVVPAKPYQSGSHELANAVSIQFCAADSAFCLVAIVQYDMQLKRSIYEIIQFPAYHSWTKHRSANYSIRLIPMMPKSNYVLSFLG